MKTIIEAGPQEIAALVLVVQERQTIKATITCDGKELAKGNYGNLLLIADKARS